MSSPDGGTGGAPASLADHLRRLRTQGFPSGTEFARALGWSQSKVSRLETGRVLPTRGDLEAWVEIAAARAAPSSRPPIHTSIRSGDGIVSPSGLVEELWAVRERTRIERSTATSAPTAPSSCRLDQYARKIDRTTSSTWVRDFQIGTFPLVLQTHDYLVERLNDAAMTAPRLFDERSVDSFTRMRVREQALLYDPDRSLQLIVAEGVMYTAPGPTMVAQLDRIAEITTAVSSTLDLRVLPHDVPHPTPVVTAFTLFEDAVLVPSLAGDLWFTDTEVLDTYTVLMDELARRSVGGEDALELVQRARRRMQ